MKKITKKIDETLESSLIFLNVENHGFLSKLVIREILKTNE
jgi:hypothetical protein